MSYFDQRAKSYHSDSIRWPWSWLRSLEARAVDKMLGVVTGLNVLDLGCGAGYYARRIADMKPKKIVAIDLSAAMIGQINDSRIECRIGDASKIDIDISFDKIVSAGLLEFVESTEAVLTNARNHVDFNGLLVLLFPRNNIYGRIYRYFHKQNGMSIKLFNINYIQDLASNSGWSVSSYKFIFPFSLVVTLEAVKKPVE